MLFSGPHCFFCLGQKVAYPFAVGFSWERGYVQWKIKYRMPQALMVVNSSQFLHFITKRSFKTSLRKLLLFWRVYHMNIFKRCLCFHLYSPNSVNYIYQSFEPSWIYQSLLGEILVLLYSLPHWIAFHILLKNEEIDIRLQTDCFFSQLQADRESMRGILW